MAKPKTPKPATYPPAAPVAAPTSGMWSNSREEINGSAPTNGGAR
mgnify:CR=1 FL=1